MGQRHKRFWHSDSQCAITPRYHEDARGDFHHNKKTTGLGHQIVQSTERSDQTNADASVVLLGKGPIGPRKCERVESRCYQYKEKGERKYDKYSDSVTEWRK